MTYGEVSKLFQDICKTLFNQQFYFYQKNVREPQIIYLVYFKCDSDVHGRGVRVVRALRFVDMIVGMN